MPGTASKTDVIDDLAPVKAAAWAWYQHGLGSEGMPVTEFDPGRPPRLFRPTRFQLEAARGGAETIESSSRSSSSSSDSLSQSGDSPVSVLLDPYEIEMIMRRLGSILASREIEDPLRVVAGKEVSGGRRRVKDALWRRRVLWMCRSASDVAEGSVVGIERLRRRQR